MATDFARLDAMITDDDAETVIGLPGSEHVYFAIDGKTFSYFKDTGKGYLNRLNVLVNALLKDYVNKQLSEGVIQ